MCKSGNEILQLTTQTKYLFILMYSKKPLILK